MEENNFNPTPIASSEPVGFPGTSPVSSPQRKKSWKWLAVLILFLIVIGAVTFFVFKSSRSSTVEATPTPDDSSSLTNIATPVPTPSATPADKSKLAIQVLNGTGIAGE